MKRLAVLLLALLPASALAASSTTLAPAMDAEKMLGDVGVMANDSDDRCTVSLSDDKVEQGYKLTFFEDGGKCAKAFPVMGKVAAWRVYKDHTMSFVDSAGTDLIKFRGKGYIRKAIKKVDGIAMLHSAQDAAE